MVPLKIAHIVLSLQAGGLEMLVRNLVQSPIMADVPTLVCCLDERPPEIIRHGLRTPCFWDVALRNGLDIIANEMFTQRNQPRRRHLVRPAMEEMQTA